MELELEIKGFFQFCRFLSSKPNKIIDSEQLKTFLDFCFNAASMCNCSAQDEEKRQIIEKQFHNMCKLMSKDTIKDLAEIFDPQNNYSEIMLSFVFSEDKIKVK